MTSDETRRAHPDYRFRADRDEAGTTLRYRIVLDEVQEGIIGVPEPDGTRSTTCVVHEPPHRLAAARSQAAAAEALWKHLHA